MENKLRLLFWNVGEKKTPQKVENPSYYQERKLLNANQWPVKFKAEMEKLMPLCKNPQIIVLAEARTNALEQMESLEYVKGMQYSRKDIQYEKNKLSVYFYSSDSVSVEWLNPDHERLAILRVKTQLANGINELLIMFLHLIDPRNFTIEDRLAYAIRVRSFIDDYKKIMGYAQVPTLIVGDFNMNPYDQGMTHIDAFCAVPALEYLPTRKIKKLGEIVKLSLNKPILKSDFFINPTWDWLLAPYYGTYVESKVFSSIGRHVIDQVIYNPALSSMIKCNPVLKEKNGFNPCNVSDHLPIFAEIDFNPKKNG